MRPPPPAAGRRRSPRHGTLIGALLGLLALVALASPALAADQAAVPDHRLGAPPATATNVEDEPVRYHQPAAAAARDGSGTVAPASDAVSDLSRIVLALLVVVGIIFGLRWLARRLSLVPPSGRAVRGVRLLSRTVISPKQHVLLLQVGRRVVVVGDSGGAGMRPLCEITDPDEVAALLGEVKAAAASAVPAKSFRSFFGRAAEPFDPGDEGPVSGDVPAIAPAGPDVPPDVVDLLAKVRGLRQQFDR